MPAETILVVDDDLSMRTFLSILLRRDGYDVIAVDSGLKALDAVQQRWPDLVLTDINMPTMDGLELLRELKARGARANRDVEVIMVTAYGSTESAVNCMRHGASDYVLKPFNNDELRLIVQRVLGRRQLEVENTRLKGELQHQFHFGNLIGSSKAMLQVYDMIRRVKDTRINCLILGESGTGKEMVARAIHYSGSRASHAFLAINCGAIPEGLVESELFGHKKGSFTGALRDKAGLLQTADQGTIFLDEVDSLPQSAQVKLLRAIQERGFIPVGGTREVSVDVRIVAATNANLEDAVLEGTFREDLYYRLNVVQLSLPPLRDRGSDLTELASHFVKKFSEEYGKPVHNIDPEALRALRLWHFPGNVRELQNTIERAVALCNGVVVTEADLPDRLRDQGVVAVPEEDEFEFPADGVNLEALLVNFERRWLVAALDAANGNKTRAARLLQMSFRSFRYRLEKYSLDITP